MRIFQHLAGILASAAGHASFAEPAHDVVFVVLPGPGFDKGVQFVAVFPPRFGRAEFRVLLQIKPVHDA